MSGQRRKVETPLIHRAITNEYNENGNAVEKQVKKKNQKFPKDMLVVKKQYEKIPNFTNNLKNSNQHNRCYFVDYLSGKKTLLVDWGKKIGSMIKRFSQPSGGSTNWMDYFGAQGWCSVTFHN